MKITLLRYLRKKRTDDLKHSRIDIGNKYRNVDVKSYKNFEKVCEERYKNLRINIVICLIYFQICLKLYQYYCDNSFVIEIYFAENKLTSRSNDNT